LELEFEFSDISRTKWNQNQIRGVDYGTRLESPLIFTLSVIGTGFGVWFLIHLKTITKLRFMFKILVSILGRFKK
jgi:hypothetical protein